MVTRQLNQRPRQRLQAERESRDWSRADVAALATCSEATVGYLETGYRRGSQSIRRRLSRLYGVPVIELFEDAPAPPKVRDLPDVVTA
jgi:transcriptional regulator with XRE-family HTH domain